MPKTTTMSIWWSRSFLSAPSCTVMTLTDALVYLVGCVFVSHCRYYYIEVRVVERLRHMFVWIVAVTWLVCIRRKDWPMHHTLLPRRGVVVWLWQNKKRGKSNFAISPNTAAVIYQPQRTIVIVILHVYLYKLSDCCSSYSNIFVYLPQITRSDFGIATTSEFCWVAPKVRRLQSCVTLA